MSEVTKAPFRLIIGDRDLARINERHFNRGARARCFRPDRWRSLGEMMDDESTWSKVSAAFARQLEEDIKTRAYGDKRLCVEMDADVGWLCALPGDQLPEGEAHSRVGESSAVICRFTNPHLVAPSTNLISFTLRTSRKVNSGSPTYEVIIIKIYPGPDLPTWDRAITVNIPPKDWIFFHPDSPGQE